MVQVGDVISDLTVVDDHDKPFSLGHRHGKAWVLFFYPKDMTPGCTVEACDFRDKVSLFDEIDVSVVGVSRDPVKRHCRFKEKYQLNFPLLSDHEEILCNYFNVLVQKNMFGKQYFGIERSTFLMDKNNTVVAQWRKVKVENHVDVVLAEAKRLFS